MTYMYGMIAFETTLNMKQLLTTLQPLTMGKPIPYTNYSIEKKLTTSIM